ncbi:MAG: response regulator transcription factor [Rhodanobacter sp.]
MDAIRLLWIDLCSQSSFDGLFQSVTTKHEAARVDRLGSIADALRQLRPQLVCIEFDYPDKARLQVVPLLREAAPHLPLLMFTEYHSEALAVWAFRSGVWDYRVKPVSRRALARSIEVVHATVAVAQPNRSLERCLPADLIEPAGHLRRPPSSTRRTGIAVDYIARYFDQDLRRDVLADLCHISPSEFSRAFKREQGSTFEHFLLAFRIDKARDFLAQPHTNISQAAYASGFSDTSYFSRIFRRVVGVTATEYRQRARSLALRRHTSI